jgi:hypothetical protein
MKIVCNDSTTVDINADEIYENLYQGGCQPPGSMLEKCGFDVLVLCAEEHQDGSLYPGVKIIYAPGQDVEDSRQLVKTLPTWKKAAIEIAEHVRDKRNVLVTCMAGLNRSGFVTALALHELTGWSGRECVQHVQSRRQMALFNRAFAEYIRTNL